MLVELRAEREGISHLADCAERPHDKIIPIMLLSTLEALNFLLNLAVIVPLIVGYRRTRNRGFLWLGAATTVWPLVSLLLMAGERALGDRLLVRRVPIGFWPFTLVERGQVDPGEILTSLGVMRAIIGAGLMLVAVLQLSKSSAGTNRQATTAPLVHPST